MVLKEKGEKEKMKGKTLLCLTFVTLMLLGVFMMGSVGTQSTTTIGVEPPSIIEPALGPGENFTVEIWVRNVTNLKGVEFALEYNTTVLTATLIDYGGVFGSTYFEWGKEIDDAAGFLRYSISVWPPDDPPISGDGRAAILNFTVDSVGESALHLYDVILGDPDGVPMDHTAIDGYFSNSHKWLHYTGSPLPPGDPSDPPTTWHELYPEYCSTWSLTSWEDTGGDGKLSISDLIDMTPIDPSGPLQWFHVEEVTVTIFITGIKGTKLDLYVELEGGWPDYDVPVTAPLDTQWHEVYPTFSNEYHLDAWDDNGDGVLSVCDDITMTDKATAETYNFHVDEVATDIIIKPITPPIAEFPLGLAMEISLIAVVAYIWLRNRRKIKPIKTT